MKKLITILTILSLSIVTVRSADLAKAKEMLYEAYIHNDTRLWTEVMNDLEKSYKKTENIFTLFELTKSQYGFMGFLIDRGKFEEAKSILPKSEKNIETMLHYNKWP